MKYVCFRFKLWMEQNANFEKLFTQEPFVNDNANKDRKLIEISLMLFGKKVVVE